MSSAVNEVGQGNRLVGGVSRVLRVLGNASRAASSVAVGVAGAAVSTSAMAMKGVEDMVGGPGVNQLNLTRGVTRIAADQHWIHSFVFWICVAIFVAVFGVMFYSILKHRKSKGAKSANFHESTAVEIAWTIIPFIIVVVMGIPATRMVVEQKDTSNPDLTVKAVGMQWKWGYEYLRGEGEGISFFSTLATPRDQIEGRAPKGPNYLMEVDNSLVVPVNKKVRVVVTANDVIHAFMVPAFGIKQDAIPGFVRDTWFKAETPGIYRGQCAELCGKEHAFMPIVVEVKTAEDYKKWVEEKKKAMAASADDPNKEWQLVDLKARGEKVYNANCAACHQPTGMGLPSGNIPALAGSALANGPRAGVMQILLNGRNAMPKWGQLSDTELAAVTSYVRSSWGNKPADVTQPKDFVAARAGKYPEGGAAIAIAEASSAAPAAAAAAPAAANAASGLPAKLYFAIGKQDIDTDARKVLDDVVALLKGEAAAKVALTGYTDKTGNLEKNLELAKERAKSVREALRAAGIAEDRIEMKKPESVTGAADNKEARRVEINAAK
jgi:cytochrome c oxidase subunit II